MDEVEHVRDRVGTGMQGVMITRSVCRAVMRVLKCKHNLWRFSSLVMICGSFNKVIHQRNLINDYSPYFGELLWIDLFSLQPVQLETPLIVCEQLLPTHLEQLAYISLKSYSRMEEPVQSWAQI